MDNQTAIILAFCFALTMLFVFGDYMEVSWSGIMLRWWRNRAKRPKLPVTTPEPPTLVEAEPVEHPIGLEETSE
jgi:hypothetical protein